MSTIRLCVVGTGAWATHMHLPVLIRLQKENIANFVGICDTDEKKARAFARPLGAPEIFVNADDMLSNLSPDGSILLVPPAANPHLIRTAIRHGVPFLVEKPPAPDAASHRSLAHEVGSLPHVIAYNRRHSPYIQQAVRWLADSPLQSVSAHFTRYQRYDTDFTQTAVHVIDTVRCLSRQNLARYDIHVTPTGKAFNFFVTGWFHNGARCEISIMPDTGSAEEHYFVRAADRCVTIAFPHRSVHDFPGYVQLRQANAVTHHWGPSQFGISSEDEPTLGGLLDEHRAFIDAVEGTHPAESTMESTLQTQEIRDALTKSLGATRCTSSERGTFAARGVRLK